jgi:peptidyl-dipeptidase Dcp
MRPRIHYAITAAAGAIALSASATPATAVSFDAGNPFYAPSTLPFQAPPFDKIRDSDYQPAIEAGMAQQLEEVRAIANSPEKPTFENTVVALEKSGRLLNRVMSVFNAVTSAGDRSSQAGSAPGRHLPGQPPLPARGSDL